MQMKIYTRYILFYKKKDVTKWITRLLSLDRIDSVYRLKNNEVRRNVHVSIYEITNRYSCWGSSSYIGVTESENGVKKISGKNSICFSRCKRTNEKVLVQKWKKLCRKLKKRHEKAAVKTVSPIIGAVEAVPITISKFQEKMGISCKCISFE